METAEERNAGTAELTEDELVQVVGGVYPPGMPVTEFLEKVLQKMENIQNNYKAQNNRLSVQYGLAIKHLEYVLKYLGAGNTDMAILRLKSLRRDILSKCPDGYAKEIDADLGEALDQLENA